MRNIFTLIFLLGVTLVSRAQQPCGTYDYESYLRSRYPGFGESLDQSRQEALHGIAKMNKVTNDTVYRIPVVFHIVWNTPQQNIHDSLIFSQLKTLNEAFRHTHKDTGRVRNVFRPVVGDTRIEFYLADKDPSGNPTTGINRVQTTRTDFGESNLFGEGVKRSSSRGADAWNPDRYLNIWVCKFTFNGTMVVAAYAFPPTNAKFWTSSSFTDFDLQGVVTNFQYVGVKNPNDLSNSSLRERTLVHEVGHFLGLRHIWADKKNTCFGEDDGLKDTPNANSATTLCLTTKNTCNEGTGDRPDMIENYMDYTPYPCTVMFTRDQVSLLRYNLIHLRPNLYSLKITRSPGASFDQIHVFPNPVKDVLTVQFERSGVYTLQITDRVGRLVKSIDVRVSDDYEKKVDIGDMSPGFYHMSILNNYDAVYRQKILVN